MEANVKKEMRQDRSQELKRILEERRLEIIGEVQDKVRDVRNENAAIFRGGVRDEAESSDTEIQDDIEFALLQMKAETLKKIRRALARLEEGSCGYCYECGGGDRRATSPRASLRDALQGLRGGPGGRASTRARTCQPSRFDVAVHGHDLLSGRRLSSGLDPVS